jgi:hypothetical protein
VKHRLKVVDFYGNEIKSFTQEHGKVVHAATKSIEFDTDGEGNDELVIIVQLMEEL